MAAINITNARKELYNLVENVNLYNEPALIVSKKGNAVLVSEDDWNALKLRCLQLYSMVGKKIVVSAANKDGKYAVEKVMEVIS